MGVVVRLLGDGDQALLGAAEAEVFDHAVDPAEADAFLRDPRHAIAAAIEGDRIVGFVSAVEILHPDKPRQLWINEVGVTPRMRRRGLGLRLMRAMLDHAGALGCSEAWVLTDRPNAAAMGLYRRLGGVETGSDLVMFTFAPPA